MSTVPSRRLFEQILFTRDDLRPGRTLLFRIGLVLALFALVFLVLWLERDGLNPVGNSRAEARRFLRSEFDKWDKVIRERKLTAD